MTPKEKAKQLVGKYTTVLSIPLSKEFALIAVDEIIEAIDWHELEFPNTLYEYWQQVKEEIELL